VMSVAMISGAGMRCIASADCVRLMESERSDQ
jgi:hypothetical protein